MEVLAFYLPQFHPIPENDAWWGIGFTEWRNVVQARPRFRGHWQPHLPSDLGFVDLRSVEAMYDQAILARRYGIAGFVMYHYWFRGRRLLGRPLDTLLADAEWPGRFCLCWANESWSRVWDGREHELLIRQEYDPADDREHVRYLTGVMADPRYIRIGNRPMFLIYRPASHPDLGRFCSTLRRCTRELIGVEAEIIGVRSGFDAPAVGDWATAVDAVLDFQPNQRHFRAATVSSNLLERARRYLPSIVYQRMKRTGSAVKRVHYDRTVDAIVASWATEPDRSLRCVFPNWDNTPRRRTPVVIQCDDPTIFGRFVRAAVNQSRGAGRPNGPIFVNAWNEWAEGCHLEPDSRFGRAFLEQIAGAVGVDPSP